MAESYEDRAKALEKEADFMEKGGDRVERMIQDTREDWESKKSSNQAPGAADPEKAAPGGLVEEDDA